MGVRIVKEREVRWPCKGRRAKADGSGQFENIVVEVTFKLAPRSFFLNKSNEQLEKDCFDRLSDSIVAWDLDDVEGKPLPVNAFNIAEAFEDTGVYKAISGAWVKACLGEAERKN